MLAVVVRVVGDLDHLLDRLEELLAERRLELPRDPQRPPRVEDPDRLLALQRLERVALVIRREQDVDEPLSERFPECARHGAVHCTDHPERGHGIGCERAFVRFPDRRCNGNAAGIRVLDDRARRQRELAQQ